MSAPLPDSAAPQIKEAGSFQLVATLTIAGLLSGVAIVGAWQATRPAILAHKAEFLRQAVFEVVPGAASLQRLAMDGDTLVAKESSGQEGDEEPAVYGGYDADGNLLGYAIPAEGPGFQDTINLIFGFDPDSKQLIGMRVLDSRETPGLGDKIIKDQVFVGAFDTLHTEPAMEIVGPGKKTGDHQVEAISGATISSKAVLRIVSKAHGDWQPKLPSKAAAPPQEPLAPEESP